ncbi:MAG: secondary thiamine-phosphate synthase enzyme YjbQ [Halobacteriales archaeon]
MPVDVSTSERVEVIDVTADISQAVPEDVGSGLCTVFVSHTTAGVLVNEHEPRLMSDIEGFVEQLVPEDGDYRHDEIDDNADAHLRAMVLGESVTVPISDGELALGTWQSILFVECDGPRTRQIEVVTVSG